MTYPLESPSNPLRYVPLFGIGRGGMGRIDLALAVGVPGAEQLVVLKRLLEPEQQTEQERASLLWEARLSARLNHPNIVATLGLEILHGEIVLVLEYLEGASLAAMTRACVARAEALPRRIMLRALRDVLAGLVCAHDLLDYDGTPLSIVHRDISPSNVLVTVEGVSKVLDFGIAKATRSQIHAPQASSRGSSATWRPSRSSVAPRIAARTCTAVRVILWEALTQRRFSAGDSIEASLTARLREDAPSVRDLAPAVPAALDHIVQRCLARDPEHRWPNAHALRTALDRVRPGPWRRRVAARGLGLRDASPSEISSMRDGGCCVSTSRTSRARGRSNHPLVARTVASTPQLGVHVVSVPPPHEPPTVASLPRARAGKLLPFAAGLIGAVSSWCVSSLPSAHAGGAAQREPRASSVEAASSSEPHAREKAVSVASVMSPAPPNAAGSAVRRPAPRLPNDEEVAPSAPASRPIGFATIDSYPWSRVIIDDAAVGVTPLAHVPLSAGKHVVVLESTEYGRHTLSVDVVEGQTVASRWQWQ